MTQSEYWDVEKLSAVILRTPGAIRNLVLRREIPFRKVGGRLMFLRREIEEWVESAPGISIDDLRRLKERR